MKMNTMRALLSILAVALTAAFTSVRADTPSPRNFVEQIEEQSEGKIVIDIPKSIMDIIFPPANTGRTTRSNNNANRQTRSVQANVLHSGVNRLSGYRVQVFSGGNGGRAAEAKAKARASAVAARFPKYRGQVYSYSQAPNWYTRVGNFQTSAEASRALGELKRAFPQYAGEMRVVRCQITIIR